MATTVIRGRLALGGENSRESRRFRFPVYDESRSEWPWEALFADPLLASEVAKRVNEWDGIVAELATARKRLAAYTTAPDNAT